MLRRLLRLLPTLLLIPAVAAAEAPKPLLWKVSDGDNAVYLLGSFHLLQPTDYPLAESTDAAFADAERVVFEISPEEANSPALSIGFQQAALREDGKRLEDTLPPALWQRLQAHVVARGGNPAVLQNYDAWAVGLTLSLTEMQRLGLDPSHGLDRHFMQRAATAGKPTGGLETAAQQVALFEEMTPEQQIAALEDALGEAAELRERIAQMHALWRAGDADGLAAATLDELRRDHPQLYARMNRDRNQAWLPVVQAMLDDSDTDDTLLVVGSMHLLGDDGLVELLRARGYRVERL
ncbi:TraB/GumN family protein [Arenimonas composti]|uniref:TraB/GumN family protein n=1 Tax=Arenimonas composti TR7-09 = DSM 18010 TaxID=1121013 RepID=A0A091BC02_9GAMM|nr:TraB/GumN family protein [Arenimonas composti]KFN49027.1 hypothetical protein P873_12850 [Arenimonas composti TR7-09 = DSM 18010]